MPVAVSQIRAIHVYDFDNTRENYKPPMAILHF